MITLVAPAAHAQGVRPLDERRVEAIREVVRDLQRDVVREVQREVLREVQRGALQHREVLREIPALVRHSVRGLSDAWELQGRGTTFRAEQTAKETKTLNLGASGALELRNLAGDISVTAGSGRDVTIEIVRVSRGRTEADAKTGLDRVKVNVTQQGERAQVQTEYPEERQAPYSVSAAYTVTAPAGTRVTINSVSGDTTVKGVKGEVSVNLISGDIVIAGAGRVAEGRTFSGSVTVTDATSDEPMRLGTISGDITIERVKARRLDVEVTSGSIIARDVSADAAELRSLSGDIAYAGRLARGGRYALQTHSGSVRITASGSVGFEFQGATFNGSIRPEAGVDMKTTTSTRGRMRGTVGDGGATVTATTFSGNILIGRAP